MTDAEKNIITAMLDELIRREIPGVSTCKKYGGILYTLKPDEKEGQFCGIFSYKKHVHLAFAFGTQLIDPTVILEGSGKYRRHVNFKSANEIDEKPLAIFIKQSAKLQFKAY